VCGPDVHARSVVACAVDGEVGEIRVQRVSPKTEAVVERPPEQRWRVPLVARGSHHVDRARAGRSPGLAAVRAQPMQVIPEGAGLVNPRSRLRDGLFCPFGPASAGVGARHRSRCQGWPEATR
jgi:hypothetical protein